MAPSGPSLGAQELLLPFSSGRDGYALDRPAQDFVFDWL